jgi:phosphatidate phosphatase APP1
MVLGGILKSLTQGTQAYKTDRMNKIHDWLPTRKFICVGDSTQSDPEAYAEMYEKYPDWIVSYSVSLQKLIWFAKQAVSVRSLAGLQSYTGPVTPPANPDNAKTLMNKLLESDLHQSRGRRASHD